MEKVPTRTFSWLLKDTIKKDSMLNELTHGK